MPTERVIEIPWVLGRIPQSGTILDVGSCEAVYLAAIQQVDRQLHCLDPRDCRQDLPAGAVFHHQSLIGNTLPAGSFDAVLLVSVIEHLGLPCYGQEPYPHGDRLALLEVRRLLRPGAPAVLTVPAGQSKLTSWYRQYSPADLDRLLKGWRHAIDFWGFDGRAYTPLREAEVESYDYRDRLDRHAGAGALACIVAFGD